ncbi:MULTISPECIES: restriction endonuclease subunit S [Campylobacter]|uniref:Restriction endonuclease subunit S n=1 Tax=Campylobacter vicugnae TaxID=1660076 RepID=A0ABZ2E867_9BACT|nr:MULTISPECIES: restriction endonuclease subunit S [unclassified Campylobacter]MCR8690812.1 restriction endonuclease subunit S [Campylobacter sp. RM9264]MCR8701850.1 restriction endonuclease subunit S [Campylobacter sp. RM12176]
MADSSKGIPFLTGGNLKEGKLDISGASYITKEKHEKLISGHLVEDDIVIAVRGSLGYVNKGNFGWNINSQLAILRTDKKELYGKFLLQFLISDMGQNELLKRQTGSALKQLPIGVIKDVEVPITLVEEQTKIGELFANLDNLITLHQRKVEKLQKIKKSCLQNLFPQNNQNTPKIRFKNFNDEWVENKYKNIGQCLSGGTLSYEDLDKNGIYKCILYGELYTRYDYIIKNIVFRTNKLGNKVIKNDILFPQSTTVDAISLISPACMNDDEAQTSGVFAIRPHKNIDGNFITYYTKGNFYQRNKLAKNAQGLTIVHLYYQSIKDETILIPNLAEQCKISEFFTKLDKLITLQQRKVEKLKNIKKALLNKMLI